MEEAVICTALGPPGEVQSVSTWVHPAEHSQGGDGLENHLIVIRLCDFLYWQTICQQLLFAEQQMCSQSTVSFPSTPSPHAHCYLARLCAGPRSAAAAKARLSRESEEGGRPLWGASRHPLPHVLMSYSCWRCGKCSGWGRGSLA